MSVGSGPHWAAMDQETYDKDLYQARAILSDALEELPLAPSPEDHKVQASRGTLPQVVVNVSNVLSQTVEVNLSQLITSIDSLPLDPAEKERTVELARSLAEESRGQQRWPLLAKSLDSLKAIGKSVYENIAVPLLLEMLKKQSGL